MSKKKSKKSVVASSDRLVMRAKQSQAMKAKVNPFERKFTREKHKVVNRKPKGRDLGTGKPGQSRLKAIQKREKTLLVEYAAKDKANVMVDKRIGQRSEDQEQALIERFAKERTREMKAKRFQLADDDEDGDEDLLTHGGKAIRDIERFEDPREEDDDPDNPDEEKKLNAEFVDRAHFGGFMTQSDIEFASGKSNSRKEWIESMIAESKKRKMEKQKVLEETESKTIELDQKWKSLHASGGAVAARKSKWDLDDGKENKEVDPYDMLFKQLGVSGSGAAKKVASDRLKTDEEIAADEKARLEKLEADRLRRMKGDVVEDQQDEEDEASEEEEAEDEEEEDGEEEDGSDEDESDGHSDLEDSDSEDEEKAAETKKAAKVPSSKPPPKDTSKIMAAARQELPYIYGVPEHYDDLSAIVSGRSANNHGVILERMIKCNHPRLGGDSSREKMERLFQFLLQLVHDLAVQFDPELKEDDDEDLAFELRAIERLTPHLYTLAEFSPANAARSFISVIREKYDEYVQRPRSCVGIETLIFLKLACILFPTSDYRHPVTTPAFQFMSHVLAATRFTSRASLATGLFVASLFTESLQLSKRFSPELLNFLSGILYSSYPNEAVASKAGGNGKSFLLHVVPPFRPVGPDSKILWDALKTKTRGAKTSDKCIPKLVLFDCKSAVPVDATFAHTCLLQALDLANALLILWSELPSTSQLGRNALGRHIDGIVKNLGNYPAVREAAQSLQQTLSGLADAASRRSAAITAERQKPKILRLYEPEIEDNFDPFSRSARSKSGGKAGIEKRKLQNKMRRETKGARKEIRADAAFIANLRAKQTRETDAYRKRKTKELLAGLGDQEGDFRKLQKKKKHMK